MDWASFSDIAIVSCGTLSLELNHLRETGFLNARQILYTTPGLHETPLDLEKQLLKQIAQDKDLSMKEWAMVTPCARCGKKIEEQQCCEYHGNVFCEDCYMDILSPMKDCDPWAVRSAQTFLKGKDKLSTLTPLQQNIVNYIREKKEATLEEMIDTLNLAEEILRREFAVLRHMEILKATKKG